jgi:superfamily II DNA or RNA helicase
VEICEYFDTKAEYSQEIIMFKGRLNTARMINNICDYGPRTEFIINKVKDILENEPDRKILILTDRRSHVDTMVKLINLANISAGAIYGGLKDKDVKISEAKQVIVATYSYVAEGFDVAGLNTLILGSPKVDILQSVGRIQRDKVIDRQYMPKVIDIVDNFSIFPKQAKKRLAYYKKNKYHVIDQSDVFKDKTEINLPTGCLFVDDT